MIEQNEDTALRSKLLTRIIIAVALILAAIVVLTVVEHFSSNPPPKVAPPAPPAAPRPALPAAPPKPVQPRPASAPLAVSAPLAASTPAPALPPEPVVTRVETPPPPAVSNVAPEAKPKAVKKAAKKKTDAKEKKAASSEAKKPVKSAEKGDFTLQFGVFSSTSNSEKMVSVLEKKGLKPAIDYRVMAGPYPDKASAEKERKALGGNLVPLAKGYALQVGDFASLKHADALSGELRKKGVQVALEARIRAGRYVSRSAALEEAKKLGISAIAVRR